MRRAECKPRSWHVRASVTTLLVLVALVGVLLPFGASTQDIAKVSTDKDDYAPGEVVTITGTGWLPGELISISLQRSPQTQPDVPLSSVADVDGNFTNTQYTTTQQDMGVIFTLTATGEASGRKARLMFTDAIAGRPGLTNTSSTNLGATGDPSTLATALVGTGISNLSNVTYRGNGTSSGTFSNGTQDTGIESGIFLDTSWGPQTPSGDSQLSALLQSILPLGVIQAVGFQTTSATTLEFDFVPSGGIVQFEYVFASYDYYAYNDIFAYFVNGQNAGFASVYPTFGPNPAGPAAYKRTTPLIAQFNVQPGVVNRLKLVVADHSDTAIDSFVFIKAGSLKVLNSPPVAHATAPATVECPASVTLDASGSTDPDGDGLTVEWKEGAAVLGTGTTLDVSLPLGPHTITLTVTDPSGATSTDEVTVEVVDTTSPTLNVPPDVSMSTDASSCSAVISDAALGSATASDGCSSATVSRTGIPAGNVFPLGETTITYTATDESGNTKTGTQKVTVADNTKPTINVPSDIVVNLPTHSTALGKAVTFNVTANDSCSEATVTSNPASGSVFPVGTTTVTSTASDAAGNTASRTFNVTVHYNFIGFYWPIRNLPVLNSIKAGLPTLIVFSLSGNKGKNIFAPGYPASGYIPCNSTEPVEDVEEIDGIGNLDLIYDHYHDLYIYSWKTERSWKGKCRQLVVLLNDGTYYRANFKFK